MKTLAMILLLISGFLCVLSKIIQLPELEFYVKPTVMPLCLMWYWFSDKRFEFPFLAFLFLSFLVDVLLLVQIEGVFLYVLVCNIFCYSILFYFLYKNYQPFRYSKVDVIYLIVFFVGWSVLMYTLYDRGLREGSKDFGPYVVVYMSILYFVIIGGVLNYVNIRSPKSLWFLIAVVNFFIGDASYALNRFYLPSIEFEVLNSLYQFLAIFFLVKFKISSGKNLKFDPENQI